MGIFHWHLHVCECPVCTDCDTNPGERELVKTGKIIQCEACFTIRIRPVAFWFLFGVKVLRLHSFIYSALTISEIHNKN